MKAPVAAPGEEGTDPGREAVGTHGEEEPKREMQQLHGKDGDASFVVQTTEKVESVLWK